MSLLTNDRDGFNFACFLRVFVRVTVRGVMIVARTHVLRIVKDVRAATHGEMDHHRHGRNDPDQCSHS